MQNEEELYKRATQLLLPFFVAISLFAVWIAIEAAGQLNWIFVVASLLFLLLIVVAVSAAFKRSTQQRSTPHS